MTGSKRVFSRSGMSLASVAALLALAACGGGGGGGGGGFPFVGVAPPPPAPAPPAAQKLEVKVVDGVLRNANVFLDKNNNGLLDSGEPSGRTDTAGKVTLEIDAADAGKYPVVALVGTDAVDAELGPVKTAYVLKAPADKPGLVSPLTTLVHYLGTGAGATSAEAEANLRAQLGLGGSLFDDYTANGDLLSATTAATLVAFSQAISRTLADSIGTADISGGTISAGDISLETQRMLLDKLTSVRNLVNQEFSRASCAGGVGTKSCQDLMAGQSTYYATSPQENQLRPANIGVAVGLTKLAAGPSVGAGEAIAATGILDWFTISDSNNWSRRLLVSTVAENTPVDGLTHFRDRRERNVAGTVTRWASGGDPARAGDLHWNGRSWLACADSKNTTTVRDAAGRNISDYCDGLSVSRSRRIDIDISGQKLADVVNRIKSYPYTSNGPYGSRYANWGPQASAAAISADLDSATFPAGSRLRLQGSMDLATAIAYDVRDNAKVQLYPADIAQGGDSTRGTVACAATPLPATARIATLETLIQRSPGVPCVFGAGTIDGDNGSFQSGPKNEWWGATSIELGTVGGAPLGTAATITGYYTGNYLMRASFAGGSSNAVTFLQCQQRVINGSPRNCIAVGTGTYRIETLGDARVLSFSQVGDFAQFIDYERVFVERGGEVSSGYKSKAVGKQQLRLNLAASNALFAAYAAKGATELTPIVP